ncbi:Lrp/AsnC family leucine-responsive transcriptional regulator [Microbacterium sp. SORGH_AS 1204]|uniref:Lrp/AsnC family transcriptional regulator n=1 Tax=Microbacterium sp. SORGH_AS_1204 TaxID=3041785 RepID=UPI0027947901|nr:Lrp/AsnC family transcriptional regulator [Microbacterium sp. SORGH_AS_1204]MDQ1135728.1 Lrp/AsnC family leucine-responsive transcriptional regulator [Microbacterium sp. SORGH_AS_1204]
MDNTRIMDAVDAALVTALQSDARLPLTELARIVHLGTSATRSRLMRLEEHAIITGYTATVLPPVAGFSLHAIVRMKVHGSLFDQVNDVIQQEPQVVRCLRITGESCYSIEVLARDMADLERITSRFAKIGSITTDLVYEVVTNRPTPVLVSEP